MTLPSRDACTVVRAQLWCVGEYASTAFKSRNCRPAFIADGNFDVIPGTEDMPYDLACKLVQRHNADVLALGERLVSYGKTVNSLVGAARNAMTSLDGEIQMIEMADVRHLANTETEVAA